MICPDRCEGERRDQESGDPSDDQACRPSGQSTRRAARTNRIEPPQPHVTPGGVASEFQNQINNKTGESFQHVLSIFAREYPLCRFVRKAMATFKRDSQHAGGVLWSLDILESERERKYEVTSPVCRFVRKVMATLKRESEHAGGVLRI